MFGWFSRKKNLPNKREVRALWDISQHVLKTAGAVRDDVVAARSGNPALKTQEIDSNAVSKYQAGPSSGNSYLMLGHLRGKSVSFDDMENLFFFSATYNFSSQFSLQKRCQTSIFGRITC